LRRTRVQVPLISLSSASSLTRVPVPWLVRAVPDTRAQLEALFSALSPSSGQPTAVSIPALVPSGRAGRGTLQDLDVVTTRLGLRFGPVIEVEAPLGPASLDALDEQVPSRDRPIVVWLADDAARDALEQLVARGWTGEVLLPWQVSPHTGLRCLRVSLLDPRGADADTTEFVRAHRQAFGTDPDAAAAAAHDAAALLIEAVRQVGTDRTAIRAWLADSVTQLGPTGPMQFDATGNRVAAWSVPDARARVSLEPTRTTAPGN